MRYAATMLACLMMSALSACSSAPSVTIDCAWYESTLPNAEEIRLLSHPGLIRVRNNIDDNDESWERECPAAQQRLTTTKKQ